jgi:hypothetical protein
MADTLFISHGPASAVLAVLCVVVGGPWFADGLRALRARRALRALPGAAGARMAGGPLHLHGRVALESPMFAPLSGRPCASWELHLRDERGMFAGRANEARDFRLVLEDGALQVPAESEWRLGVTGERTFGSPAEMSEHLLALLERSAELRWLTARGSAVTVAERALYAGAEAHVLGVGMRGAVTAHEPVALARTGTDDIAWHDEPQVTVGDGQLVPCADLDRCIVSDHALEPRRLAPPLWRAHGVLFGPALALAGLLELAGFAGRGLGAGM